MQYKEFEQAVETLGLCTKMTYADLKSRYKELAKIYHPDAPNGDAKHFDAITKAYKLLKKYMQNYKFSFEEEEFKEQYPSVLNMQDWISGRVQ